MPITPAELDLIKALGVPLLGAPVGALITILALRRNEAANRRTQKELAAQDLTAKRALALDDRLFGEQMQLYAQALDVLDRVEKREMLEDWRYMPSDLAFIDVFVAGADSLRNLNSRFRTTADDETREVWPEVLFSYDALANYLKKFRIERAISKDHTDQGRLDEVAEANLSLDVLWGLIRRRYDEVRIAEDDLLRAMRAGLHERP